MECPLNLYKLTTQTETPQPQLDLTYTQVASTEKAMKMYEKHHKEFRCSPSARGYSMSIIEIPHLKQTAPKQPSMVHSHGNITGLYITQKNKLDSAPYSYKKENSM
jgi:hypothetical protein